MTGGPNYSSYSSCSFAFTITGEDRNQSLVELL